MTKALVWLPHSYSGSGPAESCVRIIEQFPDEGFETCLFVNRAKAPVPDNVTVIAATGGPLRQVPYRFIVDVATYRRWRGSSAGQSTRLQREALPISGRTRRSRSSNTPSLAGSFVCAR